jgi:CubicO group peptidase (beta-lactamase class C family)
MIKPFTATVIAELCKDLRLSLESDIATLLAGKIDIGAWPGITLRHLLNSTHGLDDPLSIRVPYPRRDDGYIDLEALYTRLNGAPRLTKPGEMYSYSDVGPLVAAAVMERLTNQRFDTLLERTLLPKLGIDAASARDNGIDHICPTLGGVFTTSASDLLQLAKYHLQSKSSALAQMRAAPVSFPGWTTSEQSAAIGWNVFPGGWFGYTAMTPAGGFLLTRLNPEQQTAIAIVSPSIPAMDILRAMFPDLPELSARPPKPLMSLSGVDVDSFLGRYERGALAADVTKSSTGALRIKLTNRNERNPVIHQPIERGLQLADNNSFFAMPLERYFVPHGQFIRRSPVSEQCDYLWSGRHLWRRVS